jgi:hypothetical protein
VWCTLQTQASGRLHWAIATGFTLGLGVLLRTECAVMLPVIAFLVWYHGARGRWAQIAAIAAVTTLTVSVWTVRNYRTFNRLVVVSAVGGEALWISTTDWREWRMDDPELQRLVRGQDYVGQNEVLGREAVRRIAADPVAYVRYCLMRIPEFWISSHTSYLAGLSGSFRDYAARHAYARIGAKALLLTVDVALVALAAVGFALTRRTAAAALVATPIGVIALVHVFLYASPRYQVPLMPLLCVFAGAALDPALRSRAR